MLYQLVGLLPTRMQAYAKATVAGLVGALAPFLTAGMLTGEWDKAGIVGVISAFLLAPAVGATPNLNIARAARRKRQAGQANLLTIGAVCGIAAFILVLAILL